jgi:hypothetical protein
MNFIHRNQKFHPPSLPGLVYAAISLEIPGSFNSSHSSPIRWTKINPGIPGVAVPSNS